MKRLSPSSSLAAFASILCAGGCLASESGFVSVDGLQLVRDGKPFYVAGMNYYSCMNLAADDKAGGNYSRFEQDLQALKDIGINMVRIMASSEGAPTIQPNRMYPALLESPYSWNEDIFVGLDRCLAKLGEHGMTAILTLANTWNWSGGFGQYVSWFNGNETIPYPPSWNPYANPPYGDYTTNGTWGGYIDYAVQFYNNSAAQDLYRAHITKVVERKNTVNGKNYKTDPAILAWELANEPQPPIPYEWINGTAAFIHEQGVKQLVTTGFEGKQGEEIWKFVHSSPNIDFACAHWWPQNQGIYDPLNSSVANIEYTKASVIAYLANISMWTTDLGKPAILEESGLARDEWENVAKGAPESYYLYNAAASVAHRNAYFSAIVQEVLQYFEAKQGVVGFAPWSWGGWWRPTDNRNQFNELWAGDPPHEAPGWYDLYNKDTSTIAILKDQVEKANKIIDGQ